MLQLEQLKIGEALVFLRLDGEGVCWGHSSQLKQLIVGMLQLEQLLEGEGFYIVKLEGERWKEK